MSASNAIGHALGCVLFDSDPVLILTSVRSVDVLMVQRNVLGQVLDCHAVRATY